MDRFIIFLGNLSLGSFVGHYLLSFKAFRSLESSMADFFGPMGEALHLPGEILSFGPTVFLVTQGLIFFMNLFLGRTLFDLMAGTKNSGPWWWQRIGGAARSVIDIFLAPFLVFDLPVVLKVPSVKERITGSYSLAPQQGAKFRILLITPFFILFTIISPLMSNLELIDGLHVASVEMDAKKLEKGESFSDFREVESELFHFKSFTSLAQGNLVLLPEYDRVRARNKKKITPTLLIYDLKNKTSGHWRVRKQISLLTLLSLGRRGNPLFGLHFPHLNGAISLLEENPKSFSKMDSTSRERLDALFSPDLQKEIELFLKSSFELGMDKVVGHTLTFGPFMRGFVEVRQAILSLLPRGAKPEVDIIRLGNQSFLRFRQNHNKGSILGKSITESYLPISTEHSVLFELGWDGDLSGALSAKLFRESILSRAQWLFDFDMHKARTQQFLERKLGEVSKASALFILDLLVERNLKKEEQDILEKVLYRFYYDICREAISESDDNFYTLVRDNYGRLSSFIEYKNSLSSEKNLFSKEFNLKWKELWNALRLKKIDFFKEENSSLSEEIRL